MSEKFGDFTPVVKVSLQRADPVELVRTAPLLKACPLVKALGARVEDVLKRAVARRYADKVVLFQQGDTGSSLLFVLGGEVRLFARRDRDAVELGVARAGEVLGEAEVLAGGAARAMSAVAQGPVDVAELPREVLLVGGAVPRELAAVLEAARAARAKLLDDLTDFMNRW